MPDHIEQGDRRFKRIMIYYRFHGLRKVLTLTLPYRMFMEYTRKNSEKRENLSKDLDEFFATLAGKWYNIEGEI